MSIRSEVLAKIAEVAKEHNKTLVPISDDLPLLESGLDSLCMAVVVVRLEEALGIDPFADFDGSFPVTVGDLVRFYENASEKREA